MAARRGRRTGKRDATDVMLLREFRIAADHVREALDRHGVDARAAAIFRRLDEEIGPEVECLREQYGDRGSVFT